MEIVKQKKPIDITSPKSITLMRNWQKRKEQKIQEIQSNSQFEKMEKQLK
jgi:hypothetical protein